MKKILLLMVVGVLVSFTASAQSLSLSWDGEPIGETLVVYGAQTDAEIVAHVLVTNESDHSIDVQVLRNRIEMQPNSNSQFCWAEQCYPPNTDLSFDILTIAPGESCSEADAFSGHYIPGGDWGDSYIEYTFFNTNNEDEAASVIVQYSATTTGIGENKEALVSVFPNPADNYVNVESNSRIDRINIFDLTGKTIYSEAADQNNVKVNIDFLERGIYLIKLETENGILVEKLNVR